MIIKSLEELEVFQLARRAADEISAILKRPSLRRDRDLHDQLASCSGRVGACIAEGFGQSTDRQCAHYERIARGSANEMHNHLSVAAGRRHISDEEARVLIEKYTIIGKKLTRWIQHLEREDRHRRGTPNDKPRRPEGTEPTTNDQ